MAKKPGLGERACPKCKETIKADALICKHCRTEFSAEEVVAAKAAKQRDAKYAGFGCLGLVLLLGFCGYVAGDGGAAPAIPDRPGPTAKADVSEFYRKVMDVVQPCDQAGKRMAEAASAGNLVSLYQTAGRMESECLPTSSDIAKVDVPSSIGKEAHKKLTDTLKVCENTYLQRWSAAKKMQDALDEGGAIGRVAELKEATELVQTGTMLCVGGLVGEAMQLGATEADLGISTAEK